MKKRIGIVLASLLALSLLCGCSFSKSSVGSQASNKIIIGYANMADTDVFCMTIKTAFDAKIKNNPNVEVHYADANGDVFRQLDQIDTFIVQKVKAIYVVPVDYDGIVPGIKDANAAGIPVITLGVQSNGGDYTFIGSKNYNAGKMQGEYMKDKLPQNAKILYLQGTSGLYHSKERLQGFTDACLSKRLDVKVLASLDGEYDRAKAMKITEDWIQTFPQFDAIIAANDQMALGAIEALKTANRLKGVMISGVDGTKDALNAIKAGEMSQSIYQDAVGQADKGHEVLQTILKGEKPPKEVILPFESITKDNVDKYIK